MKYNNGSQATRWIANNIPELTIAAALTFGGSYLLSDNTTDNEASAPATENVDPNPSHRPTKSNNPFSAFKYIG